MDLKCCLCLDPSKTENPILKCEKCDLAAHVLCYGIIDVDKFVCSPCGNDISLDEVKCEICHRGQNALKKTTSEGWVHVICALFSKGVEFVDTTAMEPIDTTKFSQSKKPKSCVFCDEKFGTLKCSGKKCNVYLHASCALKNECIEELLDDDEYIKFQGYCSEHKPNPKHKRLSSDNINFAVNKRIEQQQATTAARNNADWINLKIQGMYYFEIGLNER